MNSTWTWRKEWTKNLRRQRKAFYLQSKSSRNLVIYDSTVLCYIVFLNANSIQFFFSILYWFLCQLAILGTEDRADEENYANKSSPKWLFDFEACELAIFVVINTTHFNRTIKYAVGRSQSALFWLHFVLASKMKFPHAVWNGQFVDRDVNGKVR